MVPLYLNPVAKLLAKDKFKIAKSQVMSGTRISTDAQIEIQKIIDELTAAKSKPDKTKELEIIRESCQSGEIKNVKPTKVDLYLEDHNHKIYLIDLKTAKPNRGGFKEFKRTLLEWSATALAEDPQAKINTLIAIPYNPYEPKPYSRWTMAGMIDLEQELKVAEEFWNFVGGEDSYDALLDCFERVGIKMRDEIDDYFSRY